MKKSIQYTLLAALSTTALAGCQSFLAPTDISAQAEELMAFEVNLDDFVPEHLSESAYTDGTAGLLTSPLAGPGGPDRYQEDNGVGVQMQAYHTAYQQVKTAFTGIERFQQNREAMLQHMRRNNMFGRGNRFRNIVNNMDYEVVVADGVTSIVAQFDLGTYEVQRTTDEVTGDVLTWGSFTNPYGVSISFLTTNDDLLQVSVDRPGENPDTYISFLRDGDVITANLVKFVSTEASFEVLGAGQAIFEPDYSYVGFNTNNEVGIVQDYFEMEVYSTVDSTLIAARRDFKLLRSDYDLLVLPIVTLGDFTQDDISRSGRGRISIEGVTYPTSVELLAGTSSYAVMAEGRVRYTGNAVGMPFRAIESLTLQMDYEAYVTDGLPAPFVSSVVDFESILTKLNAAIENYQTWFSGLTADDVTFTLPEVAPLDQGSDEGASNDEPALEPDQETTPISSGVGV